MTGGSREGWSRRVARGSLMSLCTAAALAAANIAVSIPARAADTQIQTCPVGVADPDPVTLVGPATLSPPDHLLYSYSISSSETAAEAGDGLPHGVTISYSITTIDTPGGSSINNVDTVPSSGSASGDFTTTTAFQLRAELPGTARTYQIDWTASFDGSNGVSLHTCSSTDGTHHPFTVSVQLSPPVVPEAPFGIMLPLAGVLVGGTWLVYRRRRGHQ